MMRLKMWWILGVDSVKLLLDKLICLYSGHNWEFLYWNPDQSRVMRLRRQCTRCGAIQKNCK